MEYYSAIQKKGNTLSTPKATWVDLEDVTLSEKRSQSQKVIYCMIPLKQNSQIKKLLRRTDWCWGWREVWAGQGTGLERESTDDPRGDGTVLYHDCSCGYMNNT